MEDTSLVVLGHLLLAVINLTLLGLVVRSKDKAKYIDVGIFPVIIFAVFPFF